MNQLIAYNKLNVSFPFPSPTIFPHVSFDLHPHFPSHHIPVLSTTNRLEIRRLPDVYLFFPPLSLSPSSPSTFSFLDLVQGLSRRWVIALDLMLSRGCSSMSSATSGVVCGFCGLRGVRFCLTWRFAYVDVGRCLGVSSVSFLHCAVSLRRQDLS